MAIVHLFRLSNIFSIYQFVRNLNEHFESKFKSLTFAQPAFDVIFNAVVVLYDIRTDPEKEVVNQNRLRKRTWLGYMGLHKVSRI